MSVEFIDCCWLYVEFLYFISAAMIASIVMWEMFRLLINIMAIIKINVSIHMHTATFDVQGVAINPGPGTISVMGHFAEGSERQGCHIIITEQNSNTELRRNATGSIVSGSVLALTATNVENTLQPGAYVVSVFDLESDGGIDLQSIVQTQIMIITEGPTPPPPSPSLSITAGKL